MPISFQILHEAALVYVRYTGRAGIQEGREAFTSYLAHPDHRPDQRQLVDLSGVTDLEQDFVRLFEFQAGKAAAFMKGRAPILLIYYAPTEISLRLARSVQRSWEGLDGAIVRVITEWDAAADILGLRPEQLDLMVRREV